MNYKILIVLLTSLLLHLHVDGQATNTPYGNNAKVGKYATIRGFNMYYETYGAGEPLLIIHGNSGSIADFSLQIPFFEKEYNVILADSRAQGKSLDTSDTLTYEMMADDLNALLDALQLDSCYVIGWSDGGINALLLAMRHPEKVKKLAITGANLWPDSSAVDPFICKWAQNLNDSVAHLPKTPKNIHDLKMLHLLTYEPHITTAQLAAIKCPTLVIGGDHDVIRPEHTLLIARSISKSYAWILPNSGHSTPIYYTTIFNNTVLDFFKKPYRKIDREGRMQ
jgi:pimeloyl-ACP methyl ester carboxylesterase